MSLTVEACLDAIDDAGLQVSDIDGVAGWPGSGGTPGFSGASVRELREALGLRTRWIMGGWDISDSLGVIAEAALAVTHGIVDHVVCFRSLWESTAQMQAAGGRGEMMLPSERVEGNGKWAQPFGGITPVNWNAPLQQRYMYETGLTREQLGQVAVVSRRHAALNPVAIYRQPLSLEEYLEARMISSPISLLDCDVPCDGATAVVVSRAEAVRGMARPPITIESAGTSMWGRDSFDQVDPTRLCAYDCATQMWENTTLRPVDVDVALLYDGFSFYVPIWLEALGFCEPGKAGMFIQDGERISLGGELPLNTQGGQLSGGRLHGFGFFHEACLQLWGRAGDRQVPSAEVAVATVGGPFGCSILLSRRS